MNLTPDQIDYLEAALSSGHFPENTAAYYNLRAAGMIDRGVPEPGQANRHAKMVVTDLGRAAYATAIRKRQAAEKEDTH